MSYCRKRYLVFVFCFHLTISCLLTHKKTQLNTKNKPNKTEPQIDVQIMSILGSSVHDQFWTFTWRPNAVHNLDAHPWPNLDVSIWTLDWAFFTNTNTVVIEMMHMNTDYLRTIMIYYVLSIDVFGTNEFFS